LYPASEKCRFELKVLAAVIANVAIFRDTAPADALRSVGSYMQYTTRAISYVISYVMEHRSRIPDLVIAGSIENVAGGRRPAEFFILILNTSRTANTVWHWLH
jgi:hypothetical protein